MSASKEKERGWQFMKWLTSGDTQYQYGKDLEGVMGVGARYNTANLEALTMLPWKTADEQALLEQMKATQGVPEASRRIYDQPKCWFCYRHRIQR